MKKKIMIIIDSIIGIILLDVIKWFSYSILSDSSDAIYKEISSYVTENESELKEIALKYLNDEKREFKINSNL